MCIVYPRQYNQSTPKGKFLIPTDIELSFADSRSTQQLTSDNLLVVPVI